MKAKKALPGITLGVTFGMTLAPGAQAAYPEKAITVPKVPTLAEMGVRGVDIYSWQAFAAPKGLPKDVKAKLHGAIVAALNEPDIKARLVEQAGQGIAIVPQSLQGMIRTDVAYRPLDDRQAVSPIIFSTRHMDRSPELVNMLEVIYEIDDEPGIAHVKQALQEGQAPRIPPFSRPRARYWPKIVVIYSARP